MMFTQSVLIPAVGPVPTGRIGIGQCEPAQQQFAKSLSQTNDKPSNLH